MAYYSPFYRLFYCTSRIKILLKERGFTLEGAKIHLKEEKQQALTTFDIVDKLEHIKNELLKIKNHL
mgnify:CR=1 FL=1